MQKTRPIKIVQAKYHLTENYIVTNIKKKKTMQTKVDTNKKITNNRPTRQRA